VTETIEDLQRELKLARQRVSELEDALRRASGQPERPNGWGDWPARTAPPWSQHDVLARLRYEIAKSRELIAQTKTE